MAQAENYSQSLEQATATGRCSTFHMIAILHRLYIILVSRASRFFKKKENRLAHETNIIHALASKRNVVCTRTTPVYTYPPL